MYPNVKQTILLNKTFGCVRYYWNTQINAFNNYKKGDKFKTSTELRNEVGWMREVSAAAIQQKEIDFKQFKSQFFSKGRKKPIGKPKFKKRVGVQSFRLPNQKFSLIDNKIRLEKIGWIQIVQDRQLPDDCKLMSVTVSKDTTGAYFVSVLVETQHIPFNKTGDTVGIDVGINEFATLSNGEVIHNPKFFRESQAELIKAQRRLSRKKKGSSRRKKAALKVARLHKKVVNQRKYFLHCLSTDLVKRFDFISVEDLNVTGMVKDKKIGKSISDASFYTFFCMLKYKCEWNQKELIKIGRFDPSSKMCSSCGVVKKDLKRNERIYKCDHCGHEMDRDLNASINIHALGVNKAKRA